MRTRVPWKAWLISVALGIAAPVSAFGEVPWLNSDEGAPHIIYLDFDGHQEQASTSPCPPPFPPGTVEGWPITWETSDISGSITPQTVREIWGAVAEDFAPFHVNVTTDPRKEPPPDAPNAIRVAIGVELRVGELGLAPAMCHDGLTHPPYLNPNIANVALVDLDPRSQFNAREIAKRISHEAGHLYGLDHHVAPRDLFDDWIMAPQRQSNRYVWRVGTNETGQLQDDVAHLAWLLARRADEPNPGRLSQIGGGPPLQGGFLWPGLYAHGTVATAGDTDDYLFTVPAVHSLIFEVFAGVWTNPRAPTHGSEHNLRYGIQIRSQRGDVTLACPSSLPFTLSTTTSRNIISHPDCERFPMSLRVGETYQVHVFRDPRDNHPGNLGRYTVHVSRPPLPLPFPPLVRN